MENPIIENGEKVGLVRYRKTGTTLIVDDSILAGIEEKRISGNRNLKVRIFPGATIHNYLLPKTFAEKGPRQYNFTCWN